MSTLTGPPIPPLANEFQILTQAVERIQKALRPIIKAQTEIEKVPKVSQSQCDAILKLSAFTDRQARFGVEIKKSFEMRDLVQFVEKLRVKSPGLEKISANAAQNRKMLEPMIVARYLSKPAQEFLKSANISYADATGNFMISSLENGIFCESDKGAASDPWRVPGRPSGSIRGNAAAKVVRALIDELSGMSIPELIRSAKSSSSTAYRVVEYLDSQALLEREGSAITNVSWKEVIRRWSAEYSYWKENSVIGFLDPRGIDSTLKKLKDESSDGYAITGTVAAAEYASYAEAKQLTMYAKYPVELAKKLGLKPVDTGANVYIAATAYDVVFKRTRVVSGLSYVGPSQIAVDLLSGPGRNPEEAQALIEWMEKNEKKWRKSA
ncbi:MAG TPA: hypothetical protein VMV42_00245 [archaeon]|nr:hypothetical protein [archaeon]